MSATEVAECMFELAQGWPVYTDVTTRPTSTPDGVMAGQTLLISRCQSCGEEIFGTEGLLANVPGPIDVVRHLVNSHGYRMDGRQFDNQNQEIGHA